PGKWGGKLPTDAIPAGAIGFDPKTGRPMTWPMKLAKAHWAALLPGLAAGEDTLRCRTIDAKGQAQAEPRAVQESGRAEIEAVKFSVKAWQLEIWLRPGAKVGALSDPPRSQAANCDILAP